MVKKMVLHSMGIVGIISVIIAIWRKKEKRHQTTMKIVKGICNVFGIIIAWVLSIALVIMLVVTPVIVSMLSLLSPQIIREVIDTIFAKPDTSASAPLRDGIAMGGSCSGSNSTLPTKADGTIDWEALLGGAGVTVPTTPGGSVDMDAILGGTTVPTNPDGSVDVDDILGGLTTPTTPGQTTTPTAPTSPTGSATVPTTPTGSATAPTKPAATNPTTPSNNANLVNGLANLLGKETAEALVENIHDIVRDMDMSAIEEAIGVEITEEVIEKALNSNIAVEVIEPYIEDLTNVFFDENAEKQFTEEKIIEVVENNLGEIMEMVRDTDVEMTDDEAKELEEEIRILITKHAGDVVQVLPKVEDVKEQVKEEIKQHLSGESAEMEQALEIALYILGHRLDIDLILIGACVFLALLIFLFRLPGFRGFRWLATILYITGIANAMVGGSLMLVSGTAISLLPEDMAGLSGVLELLITKFANGILIQAGIMLGIAIVFTVIYAIIKRAIKKRKAAKAAKAAAELDAAQAPVAETVEPAVVVAETVEEPIVTEVVVAEETVAEETVTEETVAEEETTVTEQ